MKKSRTIMVFDMTSSAPCGKDEMLEALEGNNWEGYPGGWLELGTWNHDTQSWDMSRADGESWGTQWFYKVVVATVLL